MTSDPAAIPPVIPPPPEPAPLSASPGFGPALRGVWLLTWRSHCTARGLATVFAALLALPLLAYISATPFGDLPSHLFGNPDRDARRLFFRLGRSGPVSPANRHDITAIFQEEYQRARENWPGAATNAPLASTLKRLVVTGTARLASSTWTTGSL